MASSNIRLFDENKGNMLSDSEFSISNQRMNGLQTGVASSQLQNKAMYQASLVAYAIAQVMMQNGLNANDTDAVSTFVANLSGTMLQKVYDLASKAEAQAGVATGKWMSPALVKAAIDTLAAKAQNILSDTTKTLYGLDSSAVPNDVFVEIEQQLSENVNPNISDNWYFGNPVDQRQGYVIPPGVTYYYGGGTTVAGTTDKYYTALPDPANWQIEIGGTRYWVYKHEAVRGYVNDGYTVDRWFNLGNAVLIENGGLRLKNNAPYGSAYRQMLPLDQYKGKQIVVSCRNDSAETSIQLYVGDDINDNLVSFGVTKFDNGIVYSYGTVPSDIAAKYLTIGITVPIGKEAFVTAVKLELGSQQTLAHKDSSSNWVLNEISDYSQELLKCCMSTADPYDTYANNIRTAKAIGGSKIAKGSYTGTGSYGSGSQNSLTFDFEPKIVIVQKADQGIYLSHTRLIMIQGMSQANNGDGAANDDYRAILNFSGNTVSWYSSSALGQLNYASAVYEYVALG